MIFFQNLLLMSWSIFEEIEHVIQCVKNLFQ